jgi:hypothetical protein
MQGAALVSGTVDVSTFDREALIEALRIDQAGESTFPDFLNASWRAGVVRSRWISQRVPLLISAAMKRSTSKRIRRSKSISLQ